MSPGTQRICNTFCRPLNVSARAQARHAVAPMFLGHERSEIAHMVTFLGHERSEIAHMVTFFFADFVTCANFSNLCGKFLKTHTRYGHHVSAKNCASSWATFSSKKISKKNRLHGFFKKEVLKKRFF